MAEIIYSAIFSLYKLVKLSYNHRQEEPLIHIRRFIFLLTCAVLFADNSVYAANFFADISAVTTFGKSAISSDVSSPRVGVYTAEASAGTLVFGFLKIGGRTAYSRIVQFSDINAAYGNRRGSRFAKFSPMAALSFTNLELRADYQFLGEYELSTPDINDNTVTYKKPKGFGAELLYRLTGPIFLGVRYESVAFSQEQVGSTVSALSNPLKLSSLGGLIHVGF